MIWYYTALVILTKTYAKNIWYSTYAVRIHTMWAHSCLLDFVYYHNAYVTPCCEHSTYLNINWIFDFTFRFHYDFTLEIPWNRFTLPERNQCNKSICIQTYRRNHPNILHAFRTRSKWHELYAWFYGNICLPNECMEFIFIKSRIKCFGQTHNHTYFASRTTRVAHTFHFAECFIVDRLFNRLLQCSSILRIRLQNIVQSKYLITINEKTRKGNSCTLDYYRKKSL